MERRDHIDTTGAITLVLFALLLAFNQVVIKVVTDGLQPMFFAGIRSAGATVCVWLWIKFRGRSLDFQTGTITPGLVTGLLFSLEFVGLFTALDLTTVTRTSIIFNSMPVWMAIGAHFYLPNDRIHRTKAIGLAIAFAGVAWAILDRDTARVGETSLIGDLGALLGAVCWAGIALIARGTKLARVRPEMQLFWQVSVSAVVLLAIAPLFGPFIRDLTPLHLWGLAFQIVVVTTAAFLFWLWLLTIYPASGVASFAFLSPIFGILLGWLILGEHVGPSILIAAAMVTLGIILINRPPPESS
jgi:drug/metabolite transporter (DMT)-like permease